MEGQNISLDDTPVVHFAVRVALLQKLAPVTANKMLSALRRVLLEAYRLGLMAADDYQKASQP